MTAIHPIGRAGQMRASSRSAAMADAARLGLLVTAVQLVPGLLFGVWAWLAADSAARLGMARFLLPGVLACLAAAAAFAAAPSPGLGDRRLDWSVRSAGRSSGTRVATPAHHTRSESRPARG